MNTVELFYIDAYKNSFSATVTGCAERDGGYKVALDATLFYPEGGGQPADVGTLGGANVADVHKDGGVIWHFTDKPVEPGATVIGTIDFDRRFSLMQHHTGEHILSGANKRLFDVDNAGFHMGSDFVTIDTSAPMSAEMIREVEHEANTAVWRNANVSARYPSAAELAGLSYRSKRAIDGAVRIVTVEGYDSCACCGLHVKSAGEIGVIKVVDAQKYKCGTRLFLLCGERAFGDYCEKNANIYSIGAALSAKPTETAAAVAKLREDYAAAKANYRETRRLLLNERIKGVIIDNEIALYICNEPLDGDELRFVCDELRQKAATAAVFAAADGGFSYCVGRDKARELSKSLNAALNGRGGGNDDRAQGFVAADEGAIRGFFAE